MQEVAVCSDPPLRPRNDDGKEDGNRHDHRDIQELRLNGMHVDDRREEPWEAFLDLPATRSVEHLQARSSSKEARGETIVCGLVKKW